MTPKAGPLIAARVMHERAWAYNAWMARYGYSAMRRLANLPESEGGLGYDLSESALKGLVEAAKADRGDLTMSREQRIERQSAEVDERARAARHDFGAAYSRLATLDAAIAGFEVYDLDTALALRDMVGQRNAIARELEAADRRLDTIHAREAKLHGLDAPSEARLEVTTRDAVFDELNAALEAAGLDPVKADRADTGR